MFRTTGGILTATVRMGCPQLLYSDASNTTDINQFMLVSYTAGGRFVSKTVPMVGSWMGPWMGGPWVAVVTPQGSGSLRSCTQTSRRCDCCFSRARPLHAPSAVQTPAPPPFSVPTLATPALPRPARMQVRPDVGKKRYACYSFEYDMNEIVPGIGCTLVDMDVRITVSRSRGGTRGVRGSGRAAGRAGRGGAGRRGCGDSDTGFSRAGRLVALLAFPGTKSLLPFPSPLPPSPSSGALILHHLHGGLHHLQQRTGQAVADHHHD